MDIITKNCTYTITPSHFGGMLNMMHEDGYDKLNLSYLNPEYLNVFITAATELNTIQTQSVVGAFQIAHYLNSIIKMKLFAQELESRIKQCDYSNIKEIYMMFK